jgi:site-specific recombinase
MWAAVQDAFGDGFRLLATRVRAQGLAEKLRTRSRRTPVAESPFYRLTDSTEDVLAAWGTERMPETASQWRADRDACNERMADIWQRLEREGVSIDVVYGLKVLDRALTRMELMLQVMEAPPGSQRPAAIHTLLSQLVAATREDRSVRQLVATSFRSSSARSSSVPARPASTTSRGHAKATGTSGPPRREGVHLPSSPQPTR